MTPNWIVVTGGYRTGSTLQYNLIGCYVEAIHWGRRLGYGGSGLTKDGPGVAKTHPVDGWDKFIGDGAIAISTIRDPDAVRRSTARMFEVTEEELVISDPWLRNTSFVEAWNPLVAYAQSYTELIDSPVMALRAICDVCAVPWDWDAAEWAAEYSGWERSFNISQNLKPGGYDPVTLLHHGHVS